MYGCIFGCEGAVCFPNPLEILIFTLLHCLKNVLGYSKIDENIYILFGFF